MSTEHNDKAIESTPKTSKIITDGIDTSASDTFNYYYRDGVGGWIKIISQTQIDNTQYDDGSGSLAGG